MLATSAIDAVRPSTAAPMGRDGIESHEAGPGSWAPDSQIAGVAVDRGASQAPLPQDYRASLFALQTGRMTFGQLWFSASR